MPADRFVGLSGVGAAECADAVCLSRCLLEIIEADVL